MEPRPGLGDLRTAGARVRQPKFVLTAGNRARALDDSGTDDAVAEAASAKARSTRTDYSTDGQRVVRTVGPEHDVQLANGAVVRGRSRVSYTYDDGAPDPGGPFNLVTTKVSDISYWVGGVETFADARTAKTEYDWARKLPVKEIADPAGLAMTTRYSYDSDDRIVSQTTPAGGSSDTTPSTRITVYYSSAANATHPACGGHPEWDGQVCLTKTGGQPATGPELPLTRTTYALFGQPWQATESTSAGTLRTTTIIYDQAGRATRTSITAPGLGQPLEDRRVVYDQTSGQAVRTQTVDGGTASTPSTLGHNVVSPTTDVGDKNFMNGSRFVTGASAVTVSSISAYIGAVEAAPGNQYQLAIYTDNGGSPATLLTASANGTLTANSWNSLPVNATLAPNTNYWLMYNTNGNNNLVYDTGSANQGGYSNASQPFGTWPTTFGASTTGGWKFSIYADVLATGTATAEIVRGYDTLGRQTSYTDADGANSTVSYDLLGRPAVTVDGRGSRTYTYDGGAERRGLPTSVVDSHAGTFTGSYDADGNLIAQTWGNGITVALTTDEVGGATGVVYAQPGCGQADCTLFAESVKSSAHGQWLQHTSTLSGQDYAYDKAGRLTQVKDTTAGQCETRTYTFDAATNRKGLTTYAPGTDGACQTTTLSGATVWTFDSADRANTSGYTYDALGRTLTMPGADTAVPGGGQETLAYHVNDMARTIAQSDKTNTYTLDVISNRFRSWTQTTGGTTVTKKHHYADDSDNPNWTDEGNGTTSWTFAGLDGIAGTYTSGSGDVWQVTNLHGDVIASVLTSTYGLAYTSEYTESGLPRSQPDAGAIRYGWLGGAQRAADTPGGLILMGARLYNPGHSRFASIDPVYGGSANAYEYCRGDSINCTDLSGRNRPNEGGSDFSCTRVSRSWNKWTGILSVKMTCYLSNWTVNAIIKGGFGGAAAWYGAAAGTLGALAGACVVFTLGWCLAGVAEVLGGAAAIAGGAAMIFGAIGWMLDTSYTLLCRSQHGVHVTIRAWIATWAHQPHFIPTIRCNK